MWSFSKNRPAKSGGAILSAGIQFRFSFLSTSQYIRKYPAMATPAVITAEDVKTRNTICAPSELEKACTASVALHVMEMSTLMP